MAGKGGRPRDQKGFRDKARVWAMEHWDDYIAVVQRKLKEGDPSSFQWLLEHGYGRPPQALDLNVTGDGILAPGPLQVILGSIAPSVGTDE